jgi:hemerythrin superfamily protein
MLERANLTLRNGSWSDWFGNGSDWSDRLTTRNALIFGGGAMLALVAARLASPFAGRAIGSMRAMIGADPFAALAQDHRRMLALFDSIEKTDGSAAHQRNAMLLELKRMLTAHALAEEDIIYPMLCDDAGRSEQARKLYRDHAEIKVRLFELEHKAKDDPSWIEDLRTLHQMIAAHAHEEERVEFPKLRAALSQARCATLHGEVSREKSMLA